MPTEFHYESRSCPRRAAHVPGTRCSKCGYDATPVQKVRVQAWQHRRKGRIIGAVIRRYDEWMDIRLVGNQHLHMAAATMDGRYLSGETITVRASLMTECELNAEEGL